MKLPDSARIVTITINPAVDQTLSIPNFSVGAVNRVRESHLNAGGKGINVASFLADYSRLAGAGVKIGATGFLGEENDAIFTRFFQAKGITDWFLRIPGRTRTGIKVIDPTQNATTDINFPGEMPPPEAVDRLLDLLTRLAGEADLFVLSGSVPAGISPLIYREMVQRLMAARIVLDTSGEGLRQGISAGPWAIKPNLEELQELTGERLCSAAEIVSSTRRLIQQHGISHGVVSMGAEGAVFVERDAAVLAFPPQVEVKSTVGAGDAMVAGWVIAKLSQMSLADTARLATAFSACAVGQVGSGLESLESVWKYMDQVKVSYP